MGHHLVRKCPREIQKTRKALVQAEKIKLQKQSPPRTHSLLASSLRSRHDPLTLYLMLGKNQLHGPLRQGWVLALLGRGSRLQGRLVLELQKEE